MCTSSMMYTFLLPTCGAMETCRIRFRMSSTLLLLAASSSKMLSEWPSSKVLQGAHWPQATRSSPRFSQLMVRARMRAQVVLPTPRGPVKRKAEAKCLLRMAFLSVSVTASWPTTVSKVAGRYLRALTTKFSILTRRSLGEGVKGAEDRRGLGPDPVRISTPVESGFGHSVAGPLCAFPQREDPGAGPPRSSLQLGAHGLKP